MDWQIVKQLGVDLADWGREALTSNIASFAFGATTSWALLRWKYYLKKRNLKRVKTLSYSSKDVVVLEYGPDIEVHEGSLKQSSEEFYIPIPEKFHSGILKNPGYTKSSLERQKYFNHETLEELGERLNISQMPDLLKPHIDEISMKFVNGDDGIRFNGDLFGLRSIRLNTRSNGSDERPLLSGTTYKTDYFTFRVIDSFHRKLVIEDPERSILSYQNDKTINERLFPLIASIAINAFITTDRGSKIIFVKRSQNAALFGQPPLIYPSINEALSQTDIVNTVDRGNVASLKLCLFRGLREELGILPEYVTEIEWTHIALGSIGTGMGVYALVETTLTSEEIIDRHAGKDRSIEIGSFLERPLTRKGIESVLTDAACAPHVAIALRRIAVSKGIKLEI